MAALLKNKDASERERLIISIADDATSPRPFDAAGWQADTPVAIVRGDGFIPLSASGQKRRFDSRSITSDLPRSTDILGGSRDVAKVPTTDSRTAAKQQPSRLQRRVLKITARGKSMTRIMNHPRARFADTAHERKVGGPLKELDNA
jgi:hypothetical protein